MKQDKPNTLISDEEKVEFEKKLDSSIKEMSKPVKTKQKGILFRIIDFDLDGSIDFKEFVQMIR